MATATPPPPGSEHVSTLCCYASRSNDALTRSLGGGGGWAFWCPWYNSGDTQCKSWVLPHTPPHLLLLLVLPPPSLRVFASSRLG